MFLDIEKKPTNKIAVKDSDGGIITYGEIADFSMTIGNVISERTLVFIRCRNRIGAVAAFFACISNRIVPLLLGDSLSDELYNDLIEIYHPEYIWQPSTDHSFEGDVLFSGYDFELIKTKYDSPPMYEDLSLLLSTSGSTGSPKLVRHSYKNLNSQGRNIAAFFGIQEDDRLMVDLPMNFTMGLSVIICSLFAGATVLLTDLTVLDSDYWKFFKDNKTTVFTNIPYTFEMLFKLHFFRMELPSLRILSQGGGKLREQLFIQCAEYADKSGIEFFATYGQTEGTARMAYLPPEYAKSRICSIGKAIPEGILYLIDDNGERIIEPNVEGEMVYEGPNVTLGYAESAGDLSLADERNGILYTGDIARMDSDGFFYITGRKARFLKLTGHRISLDECEKLVTDRFGNECVCTGDDTKLRIHIKGDHSPEKILDYVSSTLMLNEKMIVVKSIDVIPRNDTGKILYSRITS